MVFLSIGVHLLISVFAITQAFSAERKPCCISKTVGGVEYTLKVSSGSVPDVCLSHCIYTSNDKPGSKFCFARGEQTVHCLDKPDPDTFKLAWHYNTGGPFVQCVQPGDTVVFEWSGPDHNVNSVNEDVFINCNSSTWNTTKIDGPYNRTFTDADNGKTFYFACGVPYHCIDGNMKANISVKTSCPKPTEPSVAIEWKFHTKKPYPNYCVHPGDTVLFYWTEDIHNINRISENEYRSCSRTEWLTPPFYGTSPYKGNVTYTFTAEHLNQTFYYACGVKNGIHCYYGHMKVKISVQANCLLVGEPFRLECRTLTPTPTPSRIIKTGGLDLNIKRRNVQSIMSSEYYEYNNALKLLKNLATNSSFKNIANYHGSSGPVVTISQGVYGPDNLGMCNLTQNGPGTGPHPGNYIWCCLNHAGIVPHMTQLFASWHRLFTVQMEQALNAAYKGHAPLAIPYWDWTVEVTPNELPAFSEQGEWKNGPKKGTTLATKRNFTKLNFKRLANEVITSYTKTTIHEFNSHIVIPHSRIHFDIGGDMCCFNYASYDPIFYLHHSNVDRQFAFWQELMRLQNKPISFKHGKSTWAMEPFNRISNPFPNTKLNPTGPEGLNYTTKFGYEYDDLTFQGLTPLEFLQKYIHPQKFAYKAGVTIKNFQITSNQEFKITPLDKTVGWVTTYRKAVRSVRDDHNILEYNVLPHIENSSFDPLDKTQHFVTSKHQLICSSCVYNQSTDLSVNDTYKPVVIYTEPNTQSNILRIHIDYIDRYSPNLTHCYLDSKVEFLNSDGSYSSGVTLNGEAISGQVNILQRSNAFEVTRLADGEEKTTAINIGYNPDCHLQCNEGKTVSDDPEIFAVPWDLIWLQKYNNAVQIYDCDITVLVAWCELELGIICEGGPCYGIPTDIVVVSNRKDFEDCTNLGNLKLVNDLPTTRDGLWDIDGFIVKQPQAFEPVYYASKSECKSGWKVNLEYIAPPKATTV